MTTIHCYTGSQPTVDAPRGPALERNRAAALSMVPTSTSAAMLIDKILPELAGRVKGCAVRVPTASVSAVDLTCQVAHPTQQDALIELLRQARPDVLGMTDRPLVSSDLRARHESLVIAAPQVAVIGQDLLRIFGWYDNEWGFSARMFDVAAKIAQELLQNESKISTPLVLPRTQH
jgi:glyceraldehyde 3-phosphate dehydrogenase